MSAHLVQNNYGKARVRLLKVSRTGGRHQIQNLTLNIALEGEFDDIHLTGDNSMCLPTDTMKNTVYALASETEDIESSEEFGQRLAAHFLTRNPQIAGVKIDISEHGWQRMRFEGQEHSSSFLEGSREKRLTRILASRESTAVEAGIEDLVVLRTAGSGFEGFIKDDLTTLPETNDRILSTAMKAMWRYVDPSAATDEMFVDVRQTILRVFANHESHSVQHTLYAIGERVLDSFEQIADISFSLPNIHCLPFDVSRFGRENRNAIFIPTDEPHGLIEARLTRQSK